ncbi:hypothetical protein KQ910_04805 [Reyranella sp. MMS21-HV4-11]|uniref:PRTase-CE domain-containing protein n=1 Tax=Reyranella humidisoli TaxID=2849149 RepID=A0ABS6IEN9_9HYPH|nr:hypothetical protein [Reyranella sp. MMS21-HV4-11]MBU8873068.1 hypothetical protein [Reyranella sp. MMS21-HV4-11]
MARALTYIEGKRIFFRFLAEELLVEIQRDSAIQLILPPGSTPPTDDCYDLATAIATRIDASERAAQIIKVNNVTAQSVLEGPWIVECRGVAADAAFLNMPAYLSRRPDIVFLVDEPVATLDCRRLVFDVNLKSVLTAATNSFTELARLADYHGPGIDMVARFLVRGLSGVQADFSLLQDQQQTRALTNSEIERFCKSISQLWTYVDEPVRPERIEKWVSQFKKYGVEREALLVLQYLNRIGYITKGEISNYISHTLEALRARNKSKTVRVTTIQAGGKSEGALLYEIRNLKPTPVPLNDVTFGKVTADVVLCVDDVIGSGGTIVKSLFENKGTVDSHRFLEWLKSPANSLVVVSALASKSGIDRIVGDPRGIGKISVEATRVLGPTESIFGDNSSIISDPVRRELFQAVCTIIGKKLYPKHPLGWNDCQWCIATNYNVPNCSLPIIWASGSEINPWEPLLPRR